MSTRGDSVRVRAALRAARRSSSQTLEIVTRGQIARENNLLAKAERLRAMAKLLRCAPANDNGTADKKVSA